jgi:hypothetical protein
LNLKFAFGLLVATAVAAGAAGTAKTSYLDHDKVAKGGALVTASDFNIQILKRTGPGQVEVQVIRKPIHSMFLMEKPDS